jgi:hypothetical protein
MRRITIITATLAILGTSVVIWQRQWLARLQESRATGFSEPTTAQGPTDLDAQEILVLREQTKELPKLRNEVSLLRGTRTNLSSVRAEAARLLEVNKSAAAPASPPPGFISRQQLANAGFATPEAAVQTFFWAVNEGDVSTVLRVVLPSEILNKMTPEQRIKAAEDFKREQSSMAHFNDFGIRHREDLSEDKVVLHVGSSLSTNTIPMPLKRINGEWKPD